MPWFRTILRKHADRLARRRRGVALESAIDIAVPAPGPEESYERAELRAHVRRAVAALPPALRETVMVHYFAGLDVRETAAFLEVPSGTVKRRLHDARHRLRAGKLGAWEEEIMRGRPSEDERFAERVRTLIRAAADGEITRVRRIIAETPAATDAEGPHPHWVGAHPNGRARDGETALHYAAKFGDALMIRLLLDSGADATLRDGVTETAPEDWADFFDRRDVIPLLRRSG